MKKIIEERKASNEKHIKEFQSKRNKELVADQARVKVFMNKELKTSRITLLVLNPLERPRRPLDVYSQKTPTEKHGPPICQNTILKGIDSDESFSDSYQTF